MKGPIQRYVLLALLFCTTAASAQNTNIIRVPQTYDFVMSLNLKSIYSEGDIESFKTKKPFSEPMADFNDAIANGQNPGDEMIFAMLFDAKAFGINTSSMAAVAFDMNDSATVSLSVVSLASKSKFQKKMQKSFASYDSLVVNAPTYSYLRNYDAVYAWSDNVAIIMNVEMKYNYDYFAMEETMEEEELTWEEMMERREKEQGLQQELIVVGLLNQTFAPNASKSFASTDVWKKMEAHKYDMAFGVNSYQGFEEIEKTYENLQSMLGGDVDPAKLQELENLYKDNYNYTIMNFDKGEIDMEMITHVNDLLKDDWKKISEARLNPDFAKYVPKEAIGYAGMATDVPATVEIWRKLYLPTIRLMPSFGEIYADMLEIVGILLDEDEIYDFIRGDMLFVLNDIRKVELTYTSYDYDENFEYVEVTKTRAETLPVFTGMIHVGNEQLMNKLMNIISNTPEVYEENGYLVLPASMFEMESYMFWKDNILFICNDKKLVEEYLINGNGYPAAMQADSETKKHLANNSFVAKWDAPMTFDAITRLEDYASAPDEMKEFMAALQKTIGNVEVNGAEWSGNEMTVSVKAVSKKSRENALFTLLNLMVEMAEMDN